MENLRSLLESEKIEINWNKNPIKMDVFISFLKIETEINKNHLGYSNGWTQRVNTVRKLIIRGGVVNGVNYLNDIQYGTNLANRYNNYVNPFYLFDIMNDEGKKFFMNYYREDIEKILSDKKSSIDFMRESIKVKENELDVMENEFLNFLK